MKIKCPICNSIQEKKFGITKFGEEVRKINSYNVSNVTLFFYILFQMLKMYQNFIK